MSTFICRPVSEAMKSCSEYLNTTKDRVLTNSEGLDAKIIDGWKIQLVSLASEVAKVNYTASLTAEALDTCLGGNRATDTASASESTDASDGEPGNKKQKRSSSSSAPVSKDEQLLADINKIVSQKLKSFDPEKDSNVKKVKSALMKATSSSKEDDLDDDFEMVESGMHEADTKCPYSQQVFKQPMKSDKCIHHIDQESLKAMLRNKASVRCPVSGCQGLWAPSTSSPDQEFMRKMERFLRRKDAVADLGLGAAAVDDRAIEIA